YSCITVFGLVGNGLVLVLLIRNRRQSSTFHVYMVNLAVSDLLCVMSACLRVLYYVNKGQWDYGDFLCRFGSYTLYVSSGLCCPGTAFLNAQQYAGNKVIRMIVIILLTFLVSFMPYHVQRTIHLNFLSRVDTTCSERTTMQKSVVVTLCLAAANSCLDPLLYLFSGEGFRNCLSVVRRSHTNSVV
ncbi:unnamed protein product, partial [Tetraodon nigroviridis]